MYLLMLDHNFFFIDSRTIQNITVILMFLNFVYKLGPSMKQIHNLKIRTLIQETHNLQLNILIPRLTF